MDDANVVLDPRNHEPTRLSDFPMAAPRIFERHHPKHITTATGPRA